MHGTRPCMPVGKEPSRHTAAASSQIGGATHIPPLLHTSTGSYRVRRWRPETDADEVGRVWEQVMLRNNLTSISYDPAKAQEHKAMAIEELQRMHTNKLKAKTLSVCLAGAAASVLANSMLLRQLAKARCQREWTCLVAEPKMNATQSESKVDVTEDPEQQHPQGTEDRVATGLLAGYVLLGTNQPLALLPALWPTPGPRALTIEALAVCSSHRRKGVASMLLEAAEQTARRWGAQDIFLKVAVKNTAARALYRSSGYKQVQSAVWLWLFQRSTLLMRKQLYGSQIERQIKPTESPKRR